MVHKIERREKWQTAPSGIRLGLGYAILFIRAWREDHMDHATMPEAAAGQTNARATHDRRVALREAPGH